MTDRLVVVVVLCDLEKVVRTDAAKDERKMAEDIEWVYFVVIPLVI